MKRISWRVKLGLGLIATSAVLLVIHYLIFRDIEHIAVFSVHEIAMMPIEVLVVTMILHSLLERQAHHEKMQKLNMVIGAFFSEVGSPLLARVAGLDSSSAIREHALVDSRWDARRYEDAKKALLSYDYAVDADAEDFKQ